MTGVSTSSPRPRTRTWMSAWRGITRCLSNLRRGTQTSPATQQMRPPRCQHTDAFLPCLVQFGEKRFVVLDRAELAGAVRILLERPVRRRGDDQMDRLVRYAGEVPCIADIERMQRRVERAGQGFLLYSSPTVLSNLKPSEVLSAADHSAPSVATISQRRPARFGPASRANFQISPGRFEASVLCRGAQPARRCCGRIQAAHTILRGEKIAY